ncbi:envelope stress response membrane protein PspB [Sphingomicrobium nitratireducens]|uniref:envelope stress response membrane protein PspB n=1 Tax=Sphingomicrobium nitratireducens TaxID=2964666 RepID=UPI002240B13A|nr:envelope stress response membrane protein PspB [Sphingomicrobium nitratireducens]
MDDFAGILAIICIFIGLPWLVFHYITKWKGQATLTEPDEKLLDDLNEAARRLDDRLCTIERIMTAENPDWRDKCMPARPQLDFREERNLLGKTDELLARHDRLLSRED